ncbi:MAG TPA: hypothetical protein EYG04_02580 [Candidatus Poseidoniales archaeon]|jgi:hypothetical protein|nr:hypothetical protein [Candidatus Poseidoniales archaeon]
MSGNITLIMLDLIILLGAVVYFTSRGMGGMGPGLVQFGKFILDKAPVGVIDMFDSKEGNASKNWMLLGGLWFCFAAVLGFISTWLNYDSTALDSLGSVGWTYNEVLLNAATYNALFWGAFSMIMIGASLTIIARLSETDLVCESNGSLMAFAWSGVTLLAIVLPIFMDITRAESSFLHIMYGGIVLFVLINIMMTIGSRSENTPIATPVWLILLSTSALLWGLFANAAGHFLDNTQLEWISWSIVSGWFPIALMIAVMNYMAVKASGSPLWSRHLSTATLLLFVSVVPLGVGEASSAVNFWGSVGAIAMAVGLLPIFAGSFNTMATLKGRWNCLVEQPAAASVAAAGVLLPLFAVGAFFTGLDSFAGIGELSAVHTTVTMGFYWVVGGILMVGVLNFILPLAIGRQVSSRSSARWSFWLVLFGGLGWTITSLMGDFAQKALTDAAAEGSVGGFQLTASVFLYASVMGVFMAMRNAQASCYTGTLESDKDIFASEKSPTTLRLTGGSTSIRQLLAQGVGIDTELLVDAAEAEAIETVEEVIIEKAEVADIASFSPELQKLAMHLRDSELSVFDIFTEMDINKDMVIDHFELREGLSKMEIASLAPWDMDSLVKEIDLDGDSKINLPELDILILKIINSLEDVVEVNYSRLKKAELITLCEQKDLSTKGTKAELIARLTE